MATVNLNQKSSTIPDDADQIYYNVRINGEPDKLTIAKYSENRVVPILQNPSDYELAIVRFSVPTTQIPMFFWENDTWGITLSYGVDNYFEYLQFIPNSFANPKDTIYVPQEFVDSVNQAFTSIFSTLKTAHPAILSTAPPVMTYDPITDLLTLNVQQNYVVDGVKIYFNSALNTLMYSFQNIFTEYPPSNKVYEIVVADRGGLNTGTLGGQASYLMKQEFPTTFTWSTFSKLIFETSSVPVVRELDGAQKDVTSARLTDFNVPSGVRYNRDPLIFYPQGPLRYISLNSKYPLNRIDLQIFWQNKDGTNYPIYLTSSEDASVKILFRKKQSLRLQNYIDQSVDEAIDELHIK